MAKTFEQLVPNAPRARFDGISRPYTPAEVERLRGSVQIEYTLAEKGANRLWNLLKTEPFVNSLGAVTGKPGDAAGPRRSARDLPVGLGRSPRRQHCGRDVPGPEPLSGQRRSGTVRRINRTFQRADQIEHSEGGAKIDWFVPVVADAEAGFGGPLNSFEIMKAYIEAGAAGVHFEDQLASEKKCGHMGGKVLIPTAAHERNLIAARLRPTSAVPRPSCSRAPMRKAPN